MNAMTRWGSTLALAGGVAWVVKLIVMTAARAENGLQPIEGILFFLGLLGPIGGGIAVGGLIGSGLGAALRVVVGLLLALLMFILTFAVLDPIAGLFEGDLAQYIVDEIPLAITGAVWAAVGVLIRTRRARPTV